MSKQDEMMDVDPLAWLKSDEESASPEADVAVSAQPECFNEVEVAADTTKSELPMTAAEEQDGGMMNFESSLQIMDVARLKPQFDDALNQGWEVVLQAEENLVVDAAGLQLLLAFVKASSEKGVTIHWESIPSTVIGASQLLGAEELRLGQ